MISIDGRISKPVGIRVRIHTNRIAVDNTLDFGLCGGHSCGVGCKSAKESTEERRSERCVGKCGKRRGLRGICEVFICKERESYHWW